VSDSFGSVNLPAGVLWGAQTARSLQFFAIGEQRMPIDIIHALAWVKWAAAGVNRELLLQPPVLAHAIAAAAEQVALGQWNAEFPLSVWQTGSGTQSNMNVNEVIATLATQALAHGAATGPRVHPNDDVNLGQSSNDVFPSAMHLAVGLNAQSMLLPALDGLLRALASKALVAFHGALKMLAIALNKMANDIRLMGSGPRAGLGELVLPPNEPGSSIMPGKVNPAQMLGPSSEPM
jgi:fumarate hydratase class II